MQTYLLELLVCPVCHSHLDWHIDTRDKDRIEKGIAKCTSCDVDYPVCEGIGVFLVAERQAEKLSQQENRQLKYVYEHPEVENQLVHSPIGTLNPADQHFRALVLEAKGEFEAAKIAAEQAQKSLYTPQLREVQNNLFEYVINQLTASSGPIIDLASGRCYLAEALIRSLQCHIVITDWSLPVLKRNRRYLDFWGLYDRVSLLAFDARQTPFRDEAVQTMTTFVGIQSVPEPNNLLRELRRVVSGTLYAISTFISEDDAVHAPVIRKAGLASVLFRPAIIDAFSASGWSVKIANSLFAVTRPTPKGILVDGFAVDTFPLAETTQEFGVIVAQ